MWAKCVVGLARNSQLMEQVGTLMKRGEAQYRATDRKQSMSGSLR